MSLSLLYILCRWLHFIALMTLAGGSIFTTLLAPGQFRQHLSRRFALLLGGSAIASLLSAILLLVVQTGLMGDGWQDIANADIWLAVLQTRFGHVWQWQLAAGLAGVFALALHGRARQRLFLFSATAQLAGLAFTGHANLLDGVPGALQRINQTVHLLSAAFWAGGLLPVLMLMAETRHPSRREEAIRTLMRFSGYGHLAVALVVLSGMLNAAIILPWPPVSFRLYSQLLLFKAVLVGVMCGVALLNRYWLVPRFRDSGANAAHKFRLMTWSELALSAAVLLLVSVFATLEPA